MRSSIHWKSKGFFTLICLCLLPLFPAGCKDESPPPKPAVVKQRIQQTPQPKPEPGTTTSAPPAEAPKPDESPGLPAEASREAVPGRAPEAAPTTVPPPAPEPASKTAPGLPPTGTPAAPEAKPSAEVPETAGMPQESLKNTLPDTRPRYNPTGKVDPFAALFKEETGASDMEKKRPERILTPLEKIDLSQLKLVAILRAKKGNSAMVEDATGKGYVLSPGTYIGVNSGQVTKILEDRVVVEEESADIMGKKTVNTRELKLQKPFGEE